MTPVSSTVRDRGHPHGNTFVCKRTCFTSFWPIIHMDPVNAFFFLTGYLSGYKNLKTSPLRSRLESNPSTSSLRPLNSAISHNNNNGGLHACVRATEDI